MKPTFVPSTDSSSTDSTELGTRNSQLIASQMHATKSSRIDKAKLLLNVFNNREGRLTPSIYLIATVSGQCV